MAQDEYDTYLGWASELLMAGSTDETLLHNLDGIVSCMGMDASRRSHTDVVKALREINLAEPNASQER